MLSMANFGKSIVSCLSSLESTHLQALKLATRGLRYNYFKLHCPKLKNRIVTSPMRRFQTAPLLHNDKITINIVDRNRKTHTVQANVDDTILDVVIDNQLDFESYGVCEGTVACSTCHVIFNQEVYDTLEEPLMDEMDMLDLACGLTETSRLGCQVHITKEMEGMTVKLPEEITDARDL
uniref:Adrenodoxin-like n=1 Tax=Phallusia mammillata TaxID=59560 RepID=A0A6F9DCR0_9ASCI|nr:adrenodoxin-like [Phallusia mammillata]